jgi:hypothetical protein
MKWYSSSLADPIANLQKASELGLSTASTSFGNVGRNGRGGAADL